MKFLFNKFPNGHEVKVGIHWFKHKNDKLYWGLTVAFHFFKNSYSITFINNWKAYTGKK